MKSINMNPKAKSESSMDPSLIKNAWKSDWSLIGIIALINVVLHLIAIKGFGYFRDELYYIACSDHLAFGYVDQPPLSILLLRIVRWLLGDSRFALRLLPALSSGCFVFLAGWIARELGGKRFAVLLTSVAAFAPIGNFFIFHIYSMNFLDLLFWQACILIIIRFSSTRFVYVLPCGDPSRSLSWRSMYRRRQPNRRRRRFRSTCKFIRAWNSCA